MLGPQQEQEGIGEEELVLPGADGLERWEDDEDRESIAPEAVDREPAERIRRVTRSRNRPGVERPSRGHARRAAAPPARCGGEGGGQAQRPRPSTNMTRAGRRPAPAASPEAAGSA